jgi:hypothetical protein
MVEALQLQNQAALAERVRIDELKKEGHVLPIWAYLTKKEPSWNASKIVDTETITFLGSDSISATLAPPSGTGSVVNRTVRLSLGRSPRLDDATANVQR